MVINLARARCGYHVINMAAPQEVALANDWKKLYSQVDTVLFDCDGTSTH